MWIERRTEQICRKCENDQRELKDTGLSGWREWKSDIASEA